MAAPRLQAVADGLTGCEARRRMRMVAIADQ